MMTILMLLLETQNCILVWVCLVLNCINVNNNNSRNAVILIDVVGVGVVFVVQPETEFLIRVDFT